MGRFGFLREVIIAIAVTISISVAVTISISVTIAIPIVVAVKGLFLVLDVVENCAHVGECMVVVEAFNVE